MWHLHHSSSAVSVPLDLLRDMLVSCSNNTWSWRMSYYKATVWAGRLWAWMRTMQLSKMYLGTPGFLLQSMPKCWHVEGYRSAESNFCLFPPFPLWPLAIQDDVGYKHHGGQKTPSLLPSTVLWANSIRWNIRFAVRPSEPPGAAGCVAQSQHVVPGSRAGCSLEPIYRHTSLAPLRCLWACGAHSC